MGDRKMRTPLLLAFTALMLLPVMFITTSCAKKSMQTEQVSATQPEVPEASGSSAEKVAQAEDLQEDRLGPETQQNKTKAAFVSEDIQFEFDSSALSGQALRILNNNAEYLRANSDITVTVEGHCDDRGTDTYNNALGQRRADSVKNFLVGHGIGTNRLVAVSYGEKRPIALGQDEASWAKNRRAQIVFNLLTANSKSAKN
jgi:peptidoglycan-associated lipoprotein